MFHHQVDRMGERACGVADFVQEDHNFFYHATNFRHAFQLVGCLPLTVADGNIHILCLGANVGGFHPACVWRSNAESSLAAPWPLPRVKDSTQALPTKFLSQKLRTDLW